MLFQWGLRKKQQEKKKTRTQQEQSGQAQDIPHEPIHSLLDVNIDIIRHTTGNSSDIVIRRFAIGQERSIRAALVFIDGLADEKNVYQFLLEPLMAATFPLSLSPKDTFCFMEKKTSCCWRNRAHLRVV
jgi:spore germination protein KA